MRVQSVCEQRLLCSSRRDVGFLKAALPKPDNEIAVVTSKLANDASARPYLWCLSSQHAAHYLSGHADHLNDLQEQQFATRFMLREFRESVQQLVK